MFRKALLAMILLTTIPAFAQTYLVDRVIDGNTLKLTNGERVRLIGIDVPESKPNDKTKRDSEKTEQDNETMTDMGQEATEYVDELFKQAGYRIFKMEYDVQKKDKHGRLLAYVYILIRQRGVAKDDRGNCVEWSSPNMHIVVDDDCVKLNFLNATIIKTGYATLMTNLPNAKHADLFKELHEEAREEKRGLWAGLLEDISPEEAIKSTMEFLEMHNLNWGKPTRIRRTVGVSPNGFQWFAVEFERKNSSKRFILVNPETGEAGFPKPR